MIRGVTEVRLILEEYLGRLAVERCTEELLAEFRAWLDESEASWSRLTPKERKRLDGDFHQFMYRAAGNETLARHLTLLRNQGVLFWGQSQERPSLAEIIEDFKGAHNALKERDAERCVRVLRRHVLDNVERIQKFMKPEAPEFAAVQDR